MKKKTQKLLSLLLAVTMLLSLCSGVALGNPITAQASGGSPSSEAAAKESQDSSKNSKSDTEDDDLSDYSYELLPDDTCVITGYCGEKSTLTIPAEIDGYPVSAIGDWAFDYNDTLTAVIIPEGVTSIGDWAFSDCSSLTEITLPDSLTTIGDWVFSYCYSLAEITLPDSIATIGYRAFYYCENLTEITLPDSLTTIGEEAFSGCASLTEIIIPAGVTSIGYCAFAWCSNLANISFLGDAPEIGQDCFVYITAEVHIPCGNETWTDDNTENYDGNLTWNVRHLIADYSLTKVPTCTEAGIRSGECSVCGEPGTETVPAIGHTYEDGICINCQGSAADDYSYEPLPDATCIITEYWGEESTLTIPSVIEGYPVSAIGEEVFYYNDTLTAVIIPEGVTYIGDEAFYSCYSLTEITLPDGLATIGDRAFYYCENLTKITLPDSLTTIGEEAFSCCASLTEIIIPAGVTSIGASAFYGCSRLTEIIIPNSVTSIGASAFYGCGRLTEIIIPAGVTSIGASTFAGCGRLTEIIIPAGVTSIGYSAFYDCSRLTEIIIPDGVTSIGDWAFSYCNLTEIIIPDGVTSIGDSVFYGCNSLSEIIIPDGVTSIGASAFYGCSSLSEVYIPENVTSIGSGAFADCANLISIEVHPNNSAYTADDTILFSKDRKTLVAVANVSGAYTVPDGVIIIGSAAFTGCFSLTEITIPDSVTTIGDGAFAYCNNLTEITLPDSITFIGDEAFYYCENLTEITLPDSLTTIGDSAFFGCYSLTEITLPDSITSIGDEAFSYCNSLTEIILPDSVTSIGDSAFQGCENLKYHVYDNANYLGSEINPYLCLINVIDSSIESITIHEQTQCIASGAFADCYSLTDVHIPDRVISIGNRAFSYCESLTEITLPDSLTTIGDEAFYSCDNLTEITLPDSLTTIGDMAFYGCDSLTEITLSDSLTFIGDMAFYSCDSLTEIILPDSLTTIGDEAFQSCNSLTEIIIPADVTSIGVGAFAQCNELMKISVHPDNPAYTSSGNLLFSKDRQVLVGATNVTGTFKVPEGVTTISDYAFYNCYELREIVIPGSVTYIGYGALAHCYALNFINFLGNPPTIHDHSFMETATTAYYPADNPAWTGDVFQNYDGSITWEVYQEQPIVVTLSGQVTSSGGRSTSATVQLIPEGSTEAAYTRTVRGSSGEYCFEDVPAGVYTLSVSKARHATRTYRIQLNDTDMVQDVELRYHGDTNGDGRINVGDVSRSYAHVRAVSVITDTYTLSCADFNGDGKVNVGDTSKLYFNVKNTDSTVENVTLSVWTPSEDQSGDDSWLATMEQAFQKAHPEYQITWENGVCSEGDASGIIGGAPENAADVYMYANDQIASLVEAGAVVKLDGAYADQVRQDNSQTIINTVTYADGNLYGFPVVNNTWFMYYNKKIFSEEDIKSLDTMLEKGKVAFPWDVSWYSGSFFFANDGTLFGEQGNDASDGFRFREADGGYKAAEKMLQLINHPNMEDDANGIGRQGLIEGTVGAYFSGSWEYNGLYAQLGDDLGAAQLPTVEIGGEQKQMKAFAGSKAIGVNPYSEEPALAMAFAAYLATPEAQKLRYEKRNVIPATTKLDQDEDILRSIVAVAERNTIANTSVVQPVIPEMGIYWTAMGNFGWSLLQGTVNADNYQSAVDILMSTFNIKDEEPDHDEPVPEDPDSYPITVRFHYHRPKGDYRGWNAWIWDYDASSQLNSSYDLVEEDGEMIATVKVKPGTCLLGYIFRLREWKDMDIYEDQFVDITGIISGTVDVYVESGVKGHRVILADDVVHS